jgi:hypothetical protein
MRTTKDKLLTTLCELPIIQVFGLVDGKCTCYKGSRCPFPGKHPVGKGWQNSFTHSIHTVTNWLEGGYHIGVMLGEVGTRQHVIDVETDSPEAEMRLSDLGLQDYPTWTYCSNRGKHRLFLYEGNLPSKSFIKMSGIEIRIRNCQSVLPTCAGRFWTKRPDEYELQTIPDCIHQLIDDYKPTEYTNFTGAITDRPPRTFYDGMGCVTPEVAEQVLFTGAVGYWNDVICDEKKLEQNRVLIETWIGRLNRTKCRPPLSPERIRKIVLSAKEHLERNET